MKGYKPLKDLLTEADLITGEQLEKALALQAKTGDRLEKILPDLGYMSERAMLEVLEKQLEIACVDLRHRVINHELAALIPGSLAERHQVIPIAQTGEKIMLAMADPTDFLAIDNVRLFSRLEVQPVLAAAKEIERAIQQAYGVSENVEKAISRLKQAETLIGSGWETAEEAPVVSIVNALIHQGIKERASDIHIEPGEKDLRVRFRIDGVLREVVNFPAYTQAAIVSRIKIMSELDIVERRLPQDGRIEIKEGGRDIDIRVSTLPTILGEKAVLRILDKEVALLAVSRLGLAEENFRQYQQLYTQAYGLILITGPTGSGKTTTLYSTLTELNRPEKNMITIEDPVEYRLAGMNQVQVNAKTGLTFANGLRSILRQDPNVIMVGEIRDGATADIAVRAALTGHLVLSTLHTNDAAGAIARLTDMGVAPFLVASSLLGVMAQRLVRLICPECKEAYRPAAKSTERLLLGGISDAPPELYRGRGCANCNHTGYHGRLAIHEVLTVSAALREAINHQAAGTELGRIAVQEGMRPMLRDGVQKAFAGFTTLDEVMRVAYSEL